MSLPLLKTSIPYFVSDGSVHFRLCGELTSLEDSDGRVEQLLSLLDGHRTDHDVCIEMSNRYPDLADGEVATAIRELDSTGLIQDATDDGADFTTNDRTRWSNNFGFFESYSSLSTSKYTFQRRIRDAHVGVLGVGGIGSHAMIDLVAIGFENIRIVDFDRIELSNFNRQILYGEPFVGQRKIDVAMERAKALNSGANIDAVELRFNCADDVYDVVKDLDAVISVVDRPKMHVARWVNEGCLRAGTAFIGGGVNVQQAIHYTVVPGISGCVDCWRSIAEENDPTSRVVQEVMEDIDRQGTVFGEDTAAFNGLVAIDAGYMVSELVRLVSQVTPPLSVGRLLGASFHDPRLRVLEEWPRMPDCPSCSTVQARDQFGWLAQPSDMPF
jgi:molybdopterin/thiamine biosynthesis adenylyltransferase